VGTLSLLEPPKRLWGIKQSHLSPKQDRFDKSKATRKAFLGGRGAGKTYMVVHEALKLLGRRRCSGTICAPTYTMLRDVDWPAFRELAGGMIRIPRPSANEVEMMNGSVLRFRTGDDPDKLRGLNNSFFGVDEAAMCKFDVWRIGLATLREHGENGTAFAGSTPRGKKNWFFDVFGEPREDHDLVQATIDDNPHTAAAWKAALKRDYGVGYWEAQEIRGEFCDPEGSIFKREWFQPYVGELPPFEAIYRGWDLAASTKSAADYTCGAKIGITASADVYILDVIRVKQEWPQSRKLIVSTAQLDGTEATIGIEKVGMQLAFVQEMIDDPALVAYTIVPVPRERDKLSYALPLANRGAGGKLFLVPGNWNDAFLDEACTFDGLGKVHDDQIDAVCNALHVGSRVPRAYV